MNNKGKVLDEVNNAQLTIKNAQLKINNETPAKKKDGNDEDNQEQADMVAADPTPRPTLYDGISYEDLVAALTRACCPPDKIDEAGNVLHGARNNTAFRVCCLLRYLCDNNPDWLFNLMPGWAHSLDDDRPGQLMQMCTDTCKRKMSYSFPKTLRETLESLKKGTSPAETEDDLQARLLTEMRDEETMRQSLEELPRQLPPIIHECVYSLPAEWRPAAAVAVLPMLGTILSRVRGKYLDLRIHAPNVQVVVEAPFGSGKSNITDFAKIILARLDEIDAMGNVELNAYNELVEKANNSQTLPARPDVLVRKITGDFTVAGFEQTLNTSKGLHLWCGTSEIDEVRKTWQAISYILRKAYDNDMYGRSLQSSKSFKGERPVFFNTLLCGTPNAVNRCYLDPEDGLVSRTIFFKLFDVSEEMPLCKMNGSQRAKLIRQCARLHDLYCCHAPGPDAEANVYEPVEPVVLDMDHFNSKLKTWLRSKYQESAIMGDAAIDCFRRRDAVNGFRAALIARAIYEGLGFKMNHERTKVVCDYMLWVANFSLRMHLLKFGKQLNELQEETHVVFRPEKVILDAFPNHFTMAEAYIILKDRKPVTIRSIIGRLLRSGHLVQVGRGEYQKKLTIHN